MVSAFLELREDDAGALAATLGSLVPGAVEGVLREVVILDAGIGPDVRKLAEHAGCVVRPLAELRGALQAARGDWALLLEPGAVLRAGWAETVAAALSSAGAQSAWRFGNEDRSFGARIADLATRRQALRLGLVLRRRVIVERMRAGGSDLAALAAGERPQRLAGLIRPAARR